MIIVYVPRVAGENADVSYYTHWQGLWAFVEISLGIIVACAFTLPKFIEAKGTKLRGVLSSLTRPFPSLSLGGSFGSPMQSRKDTTASREATPDSVAMTGPSESHLPSTHPDYDIERYSSSEGARSPATYLPSVNATETPHRI